METILIVYCAVSVVLFFRWLSMFAADSTTTLDDGESWIVLILGSALWLIALPAAYFEKSAKS
ncbi:MAG: hypothetical protein ACP5D7_18595 [Limnospira sp.]